jgi:coenzyme F420 biosynthesis associated uncharacterized protein
VGPNLIEVERRFELPRRDFRLWVSIHEVTHRVQFGATPWLRGHLESLIGRYLETVQVDSREVMAQVRRAAKRSGRRRLARRERHPPADDDEQRALFASMQSVMTLLEGHASYVMNAVGESRVETWTACEARCSSAGVRAAWRRSSSRRSGFETKVKQYASGERFVRQVIADAGMEAFNRVWLEEANLPRPEEIEEPSRWVGRVAGT